MGEFSRSRLKKEGVFDEPLPSVFSAAKKCKPLLMCRRLPLHAKKIFRLRDFFFLCKDYSGIKQDRLPACLGRRTAWERSSFSKRIACG